MFTRFYFLALFLVCFVWGGAQDLKMESKVFSTKYFEGEERIKGKVFFDLLKNNEASSDAYHHYQSQMNLGSGFLILSIIPSTAALSNSVQSNIDPEVKDNSLWLNGGAIALLVTATVFYTNANKHLDDAVRKYNKSKSVSFRWTGNGVTLSF
jgi:hypothetical protein